MSDASPVLLTPDVVGGAGGQARAGRRRHHVGCLSYRRCGSHFSGSAVPVVRIEKERYLLGGAGNVARNIVALGGVATLAGVMGKDASADRIRGLVRDEGICGAFVALPQRPTTVKTRVMARRQQMLRLDSEDASPLSSADQEALLSVITEQLPAHDVVILSDYSKGIDSLSFMSRLRGLLAASPHQVKVLIDPKPSNVGLYGGSFLLTPNTKETGECAGMPVRSREEILAAGRAILEKVGCPHLLTTLGSDGMALFSGPSEVWHVPTMAQDVFDCDRRGRYGHRHSRARACRRTAPSGFLCAGELCRRARRRTGSGPLSLHPMRCARLSVNCP